MAETIFTKHILKCICRVLKQDQLPVKEDFWTPDKVALGVCVIEGRFADLRNVDKNLRRLYRFLLGLNTKAREDQEDQEDQADQRNLIKLDAINVAIRKCADIR